MGFTGTSNMNDDLRSHIADAISENSQFTWVDPSDELSVAAGFFASRMNAMTKDDMPPDQEDIRILLDALSLKICGTSRADAWRHIGISPNQGRGLLGRNHSQFNWPIFFTLREALFRETEGEPV